MLGAPFSSSWPKVLRQTGPLPPRLGSHGREWAERTIRQSTSPSLPCCVTVGKIALPSCISGLLPTSEHLWDAQITDLSGLVHLPLRLPKSFQERFCVRRGSFHLISFFFFVFLGPHPQHIEVPRVGVHLALQLLACTIATATPDLSRVCDLHRNSPQRQILDPLSEARDPAYILMETSWIFNLLSHSRNS